MERQKFRIFKVLEREGITCWMHEEILEHLREIGPTPEGDHLLFVDGVGRSRFRFVDI